jgi:D-alanine-D-alanine ligase
MKQTIGLVFGGPSGEHDVSIKSATSILENIDFKKFMVKVYYINKHNQWFFSGLHTDGQSVISVEQKHSFDPFHLKNEVDVVFPITHGPFGEDGHFQAIFELLQLPYVGSNLIASAISMDKAVAKDLFHAHSIPQGRYIHLNEVSFSTYQNEIVDLIETTFSYPVFIKPANLGSSVGISKANNQQELLVAMNNAFRFDRKILVEEFIVARELEIGLLGNDHFILSAIGEISSGSEFYDYDSKYINTDGNVMTIPAEIPAEIDATIRQIATNVVQLLGVKGLSRIDFFYDETNNRVLVNEINTLPGFTQHSMYPSLFAASGIDFTNLITHLIEFAFEEQRNKLRPGAPLSTN